MATVRKTITLTEQQNDWIKAKIATGKFTNDSEYIRDLVRRDQENTAEIEAIRAALIQAENKEFDNYTPDEIKQRVKERLIKDGQLLPHQ